MVQVDVYTMIIAVCGMVILSYFFSVINRATRIPSVLLLLATGIGIRYGLQMMEVVFTVPPLAVEFLGTLGLIMIVLEAGLDLEVRRDKLGLIRGSFFSALIILLVSSFSVAGILYFWIPETSFMHCLVYAIVMCVVSSAIVLPSVNHLSPLKKEFLVYEASFSDVIGILAFNFLTTGTAITLQSTAWFFGSIPVALILSLGVCFGLMMLLVKNRVNVKFFLVFAVLILVYVGGKKMALPSLLTVLIFGIVVNNWELVRWQPLKRYFSDESVDETAAFLKSITAETAFLICTFFFVLFGMNIDLAFLQNPQVWQLGSLIVGALLVLRFVYLRILHRYDLFPELFYIPRGLITVLLFYKIPEWQRIDAFDEGVLFFVILASNIIMMLGSILYRDVPVELHESQPQPTDS